MGQRYRRIEDQKAWPGLALNREFSKGRGLKPKVTNENLFIQPYHRRDLGMKPPVAGRFFGILLKKKKKLF